MARTKGSTDKKPRKKREKVPTSDGHVTNGHNSGNDDALQAAFLQLRGKWNALQSAKAAWKQRETDLKADIKNDGLRVSQFKIADLLSQGKKGEAKVRGDVREKLQVARWVGHPMGKELDLFDLPDRTPLAESARDAGKRAAMEGLTASPPHDPSTEAYREWMDGYHDETARRVRDGINDLGDGPAFPPPDGLRPMGDAPDPARPLD
jgi:hypothetical protein